MVHYVAAIWWSGKQIWSITDQQGGRGVFGVGVAVGVDKGGLLSAIKRE